MCGIIGYIGKKNAVEEVYSGLKNLEYRGYDSAGLAYAQNGKIRIVKNRGRVEKLKPFLKDACSEIAIGHTRWATHGAPSNENAHPHAHGKAVIVHNGIIENYAELKAALESEGEAFRSQTDSEVIAVLLSRESGDLLQAMKKTVEKLKGSYAVMAIGEGEICAARKKSPLIIGYGEGGNYCASDEPALAGRCGHISLLKDGDLALIRADGVEIFDGDLKRVSREKLKNTAKEENLDLCGYPHYMIKELKQSPATIKNTVTAFKEAEKNLKKITRGVKRVIFIGCGTAYHAGLLGKAYLENFARMPAEAETAGEFRYKNPIIGRDTAVIAVSQSGETADTLEGARLAKALGAKVIAVTNAPHSQLTRISDAVVPVCAGTEICVAATKSYTGQIIALYLLAKTIAGGDEAYDKAESAYKLSADGIADGNIYALAALCSLSEGVYFMGRGLDYAVALEASLKLKEVSYIPSEGYPAGELKHGTLAMIDNKTVSVFIATENGLADKYQSSVEQVLSRGGLAGIITNIKSLAENFKGRVVIVYLPECGTDLAPVAAAGAVQLLAYLTAVNLNLNPDKPRNLAKSVTVE